MLAFLERGVNFLPTSKALISDTLNQLNTLITLFPCKHATRAFFSSRLQCCSEGPKSATLSNAPASVPSGPYLNERRSPWGGSPHLWKERGFHAPQGAGDLCLWTKRTREGEDKHRMFLFSLRCGAALCHKKEHRLRMDTLLDHFPSTWDPSAIVKVCFSFQQ